VRFTTGAIHVAADHHHVVLPRIGRIHTHESTLKLARRLQNRTARILSATVMYRARRWYCAFQVIVAGKTRPAHASRSSHPVVGVDVGVKDLLVVASPDGVEVDRVPAPKPLVFAQPKLQALQRRAARQYGPYDPASRARRDPSKHSSQLCSRCGAKTKLSLRDRTYCCRNGCPPIDRDLNAAINLARLGDPTNHGREMGTGTGSSPAANQRVGDGRGAIQKTSPTCREGMAGGDEASTPHTTKTGTATPQGEAA
jgi:transposase